MTDCYRTADLFSMLHWLADSWMKICLSGWLSEFFVFVSFKSESG